MKKFFKISLMIILLLASTSCRATDYEFVDHRDGYENGYQTESYSLENNLDESYTIEYTEKLGIPDNSVKVVIYYSGEKIANYNPCDYKNFSEFKPQELLYLCSDEKNSLYYIGCEITNYISICGDNDFGFNHNKIDINRDIVNNKDSANRENYLELSKILRSNMKASELMNKFEKCNYNYDDIINLYNLSSE
ncbi:MAG: hypothetical protein K2H89_06040 [Oscillospiraceae bacterium]|nr:hypothetical protein [Oscillospiraceae bacterium]